MATFVCYHRANADRHTRNTPGTVHDNNRAGNDLRDGRADFDNDGRNDLPDNGRNDLR